MTNTDLLSRIILSDRSFAWLQIAYFIAPNFVQLVVK